MPPWPTTRLFADDAGIDVQQLLAGHAGLAGDAGGDDDALRAGGVLPVVAAGDAAVEAGDGGRLREVEGLALGQPFDDVLQDDVYVAGLGETLGDGAARHAAAH